jgi:hypothetical protein
MRIFEFADRGVEKYIIVLRNLIGRASSRKAPAKLNWGGLNRLVGSTGNEVTADYETFKAMYDSTPALQTLVKDFNQNGIELNVPGAPEEAPKASGTAQPQDSQAAVDQTAASAAAGQLAQSQTTPQV